MPLLSVIVPVFNEAKSIREILEKISAVLIDKEIIVVDDASTDGTDRILRELHLKNLKVIHHTSNRGKGAAFLTGLDNATGDYVVIQDADLEYDPSDYLKLFEAIKDEKADFVLGVRFKGGHQGLFIHRMGNKFLTWTFNVLFGVRLNDYATCYKLARRHTFEALNLKGRGFDIDVEIISKVVKKRLRLSEIPVEYFPRTYKQGKKIRWHDAIWAVLYMIRYRCAS